MSFDEFRRSIAGGGTPPADLSPALRGLWHDAQGDWNAAHTAAQEDAGQDGAWVHAYLHRKEGDRGNAGYWYSRARKTLPAPSASLDAEWEQIARALLGAG